MYLKLTKQLTIKRNFIIKTICLAWFLLPTLATAKSEIDGFHTKGEQVSVKNLIPHLVSNENYAEKYTFNADLTAESGQKGRFYFSISVTNMGIGDHKLHAKGVIELGDEKFRWNTKKDGGSWKNSKNSLNVRAGGVTFKGDQNKLIFEVKTKKNHFTLEFVPTVPAWRPHNGGLHTSGGKEKVEFVLFPMAKLSGSWRAESGQSYQISGYGWGRNGWSHLGPHEWQKWTQLIRVFSASTQEALFIRRVKTGGDYNSKLLSYAIAVKGDKLVFEGYNLNHQSQKDFIDKKHDNKYSFPTHFKISGKDISGHSNLSFTAQTAKKLHHRNPLAKLSWVKRKAAELVAQPMEYAHEIKYDVAVSGSQSMTLNGSKGRYEIFYLNK